MTLTNNKFNALCKLSLCVALIVFSGCKKPVEDSREPVLETPRKSTERKLTFTTASDAQAVQPIVDKIKLAYKKIGYEIDILKVPADRSLKESLENNNIDGELLRSKLIEEQLKGLIRIPVPLLNLRCVPFAVEDNIQINSKEDLKKYSFVTIAGHVAIENFTAGIDHQTVIRGEQAIKMVVEGHVQIALMLDTIALSEIKKNNYKQVRAVGPPMIKSQLFHFINERHKSILPELTKAFEEIFGIPAE